MCYKEVAARRSREQSVNRMPGSVHQQPSPRSPATFSAEPALRLRPDRAEPSGGPAWHHVATRVRVSQPGDSAEREADGMAESVMRGAAPAHPAAVNRGISVQRMCAQCEEERHGTVQAKRDGSSAAAEFPAQDDYLKRLDGGGAPLPHPVRGWFEARFGRDFGAVRVHTDTEAAHSARNFQATAYTVGRHIVFSPGRFEPQSQIGRRLLAHELAHTVQQGGAATATRGLPVSHSAHASEHEAARAGDRAAEGNQVSVASGSQPPSIQRQPEPLPNVGPPVQEVPKPPICSFGMKNGEWYWKCENVPGIGGTPEVPLDPRNIPKKVGDLLGGLKKGQGDKPSPDLPKPGEGPLPGMPRITLPEDWVPDFLAEQCRKYRFLCPTPAPSLPSLDVTKPSGIFWTDRIAFKKDRPASAEDDLSASLAEGGAAGLEFAAFTLLQDVTLRARVVGNASSEGTAEHNRALAARRAQRVFQALRDKGVSLQVGDPVVDDGHTAGCEEIEFGVWQCGTLHADAKEVRPEDRNVEVTFYRNPQGPPPGGGWQLRPPTF
jgi:Domain of unknown function (DUF4157)